MDNGAYSLSDLRRNLQNPGPPTSFQQPQPLKTNKGLSSVLGQHFSSANTPVKNNPPLRKPAQESENRKPLFNTLFGTQDKSRNGAAGTPQRKPVKQRGRNADLFSDDGRSRELSQSRLSRLSSPFGSVTGGPPRSSTGTPAGKSSVDDMTRHVFNSYVELKEEFAQLKEQNDSIQQDYEDAIVERNDARAEIKIITAQLAEANAQNAELRLTLASRDERLAESHKKAEEADLSFGEARDTITALTSQIKEEQDENQRVRDQILKLKQSAQDIRSNYEKQCDSYAELQKDYQGLLGHLRDYKSMVKEIKASASNALEANRALTEPDGYLTTLRESRSVIGELQAQLESSKQVTNILRDKLHHLASVVAESKSRIEELEEEKRVTLAQLRSDYEQFKMGNEQNVVLLKKVEELADRLVVRETETFEYLATAVATEEKLEAVNAEVARLNAIIARSEEELVTLRAVKEDHLNKLLAAQEVTNTKDKELSAVRSELKSLNESKAELRALWLEAKKTIAEKDEELLKRNPNPDLEARVQDLTAQLETAQTSLKDVQGKYNKAVAELQVAKEDVKVSQTRCVELEKAAQAQAQSLEEIKKAHKDAMYLAVKERATAEERWNAKYASLEEAAAGREREASEKMDRKCRSLEEKLKDAEVSLVAVRKEVKGLEGEKVKREKEVAKQEAAHVEQVGRFQKDLNKYQLEDAKQRTTIERLEAENRKIADLLASIKQDYAQLYSTIEKERKDRNKLLETHSAAQKKLLEAQERRAESTSKALALSQAALERTQAELTTLIAEVNRLKSDVDESRELVAKKERELQEVKRNSIGESQMRDVQKKMEELEKENGKLKEDAVRLVDRYCEGHLTEPEKKLVRHVLKVAESLNEEDMVLKDHEIRTRDNQLQIMQSRLKGLEASLAKLLREKADGKTAHMINIQSIMSSSSSPKEQVGASDLFTPPQPANSTRNVIQPPPVIPAKRLSQRKSLAGEPSSSLTSLNSNTASSSKKEGASSGAGGPSLRKLMESSDDETPLADLAERSDRKKRARLSSPVPPPALL